MLNLLATTPREDLRDEETAEESSKKPILKIGKRLGVSGGATIALLSSALPMDRVLALHQVWQVYYETNPEARTFVPMRQPSILSTVYAEAVREDASFQKAKNDIVIVALCRRFFSLNNTRFYNFVSREQLVQAVYASDDVSIGGFLRGTRIDGFTDRTGETCFDGGLTGLIPDAILRHRAATGSSNRYGLLHYHVVGFSSTREENRDQYLAQVSYPTAETIETLFKAGVDTALEALMSVGADGDDGQPFGEAIYDQGGATEGRMVIMLPESRRSAATTVVPHIDRRSVPQSVPVRHGFSFLAARGAEREIRGSPGVSAEADVVPEEYSFVTSEEYETRMRSISGSTGDFNRVFSFRLPAAGDRLPQLEGVPILGRITLSKTVNVDLERESLEEEEDKRVARPISVTGCAGPITGL